MVSNDHFMGGEYGDPEGVRSADTQDVIVAVNQLLATVRELIEVVSTAEAAVRNQSAQLNDILPTLLKFKPLLDSLPVPPAGGVPSGLMMPGGFPMPPVRPGR